MMNNVLLLTRISYKNINSRPESYTIWDAYREALSVLIERFYVYDYYDLYFSFGNKGFENFIENFIKENFIQNLFICYMAEDYTFDLKFLQYLKNRYKLCIINSAQDPETFFESRDRYYNQLADYVLPFAIFPNDCIYSNYGINSITLYSLYNKEMFKNKEFEKIIDVSFIGNVNKANRKKIFNFLEENGIHVQTYGLGSNNGFISHQEMIDVINKSKINLNFTDTAYCSTFDFNTNTNFTIGTKINSRIQQAKGRIIEIYLTKSFCLSQEGPGTRLIFDDDRIVFKNEKDLLEKIKYYLDNDSLRQRIEEELFLKALKYDAINRFTEILPELDYKSDIKKEIFVDEIFLKNYVSYHFLFFFNFLYKRKFKLAYEEFKIFIKYKKIDIKTVWYHFKMQTIYAYKRFRKIAK